MQSVHKVNAKCGRSVPSIYRSPISVMNPAKSGFMPYRLWWNNLTSHVANVICKHIHIQKYNVYIRPFRSCCSSRGIDAPTQMSLCLHEQMISTCDRPCWWQGDRTCQRNSDDGGTASMSAFKPLPLNNVGSTKVKGFTSQQEYLKHNGHEAWTAHVVVVK